MSLTNALQLSQPGTDFEIAEIERRELHPTDVRIDIQWAGICHTDLHYGHDDFGRARFPLVPGHEIAGIVSEVGAEVEGFAVGDRVGVGCISNSCGKCGPCRGGLEQFCERGMVMTYGSVDYDGSITKGGYSASTVIDQRFVLRIPDGIELDEAAPLLCAGITMYSPLRHWNVGAGTRVAVIGMGGLGHMGVKLGSAMGAEVTVLSQSLAKKDDGLAFGASDFRATSDPQTFTELVGAFDLILNTVSANIDVNQFLPLLAIDGAFVAVGPPSEPVSVNLGLIMSRRRSLSGTSIGGIPETQEMLDFCAEHGVRPEIERVAPEPDAVAAAWDRVAGGSARYRVVIDVAALGH